MVLDRMKALLEDEEYGCTLAPPTEDLPLERLFVFLGFDDQKRERLLEISATQQPTSPEFSVPNGETLPIRILFKVLLPFKVKNTALNQVASLILFLNQMLDLPGFELNELEGRILYRYVWITHPKSIDKILLMSIIGGVMLNLGLFAGTIESLADGRMTFNELLEKIVKMSGKSGPSA